MTRKRKVSVALGIFAHNEENNIEKAIKSVQNSTLDVVNISQIIVVSSGSYDKTNRIVRKMALNDKRIKLCAEAERRGKSAAINLFLENARAKVVITMSADLKVSKHAVEAMGEYFLNSEIGMVGAHPVPMNVRYSEVGAEIKILWELHHEISLIQPKCGEMVGFRNIIREIPHESAVDEATIEVLMRLLGYKVVYAPKSIVYNKGPRTVKEYLIQRRRVQTGHQWVAEKYNYRVVTMSTSKILQVVAGYLLKDPSKIVPMMRLIMLEIVSRLMGWLDYSVWGRNPYRWQMISR